MTDKICVLSAGRRCGSQYVTNIVAHNFGYTDLLEPFSHRHPFTVRRMEDRIVVTENPNMSEPIEDQFLRVLSILEACPNHKIIMKYFVGDLDEYFESLFVEKLKSLGFVFILNRRKDIEKQLLSHLIANTNNIWSKFSTLSNTDKVTIDPGLFKDTAGLYEKIKIFDERINLLNLTHVGTVTYETAIENIEQLSKLKIDPSKCKTFKIGLDDPYLKIINAEEVKNFINSLLS
jgi:hypothetical protein